MKGFLLFSMDFCKGFFFFLLFKRSRSLKVSSLEFFFWGGLG